MPPVPELEAASGGDTRVGVLLVAMKVHDDAREARGASALRHGVWAT